MRRHFFLFMASYLYAFTAFADQPIRIVGSSTVYPFVTVAAETFGKSTRYATPVVESTGTGGGFKLFCSILSGNSPDMVNASRAIKTSETANCAKNGITAIYEIKIGYDGIVLTNAKDGALFHLRKEDIFLALARDVPSGNVLVKNHYSRWSDINPSLPNTPIQVYGPPPTSGTRDAFVELIMEKSCKAFPAFAKQFPDEKQRAKQCAVLREDGAFIEAGENDNLILQKLMHAPNSLGILGYSYLEENSETLQASTIDGISPRFENIRDGSYHVSRPLFVYVNGERLKHKEGLSLFMNELVSDTALGEEGYMAVKGLIPLHDKERQQLQKEVRELLAKHK